MAKKTGVLWLVCSLIFSSARPGLAAGSMTERLAKSPPTVVGDFKLDLATLGATDLRLDPLYNVNPSASLPGLSIPEQPDLLLEGLRSTAILQPGKVEAEPESSDHAAKVAAIGLGEALKKREDPANILPAFYDRARALEAPRQLLREGIFHPNNLRKPAKFPLTKRAAAMALAPIFLASMQRHGYALGGGDGFILKILTPEHPFMQFSEVLLLTTAIFCVELLVAHLIVRMKLTDGISNLAGKVKIGLRMSLGGNRVARYFYRKDDNKKAEKDNAVRAIMTDVIVPLLSNPEFSRHEALKVFALRSFGPGSGANNLLSKHARFVWGDRESFAGGSHWLLEPLAGFDPDSEMLLMNVNPAIEKLKDSTRRFLAGIDLANLNRIPDFDLRSYAQGFAGDSPSIYMDLRKNLPLVFIRHPGLKSILSTMPEFSYESFLTEAFSLSNHGDRPGLRNCILRYINHYETLLEMAKLAMDDHDLDRAKLIADLILKGNGQYPAQGAAALTWTLSLVSYEYQEVLGDLKIRQDEVADQALKISRQIEILRVQASASPVLPATAQAAEGGRIQDGVEIAGKDARGLYDSPAASPSQEKNPPRAQAH